MNWLRWRSNRVKQTFGIGVLSLLSVICLQAADLRLEAVTNGFSNSNQVQVSLHSPTEILTGLQFDLEYDAAKVEIEVVAGRSAEMAEKVIRTASPQTNRLRVLVFGMNQTVITNGVVALIRATPIGPDGARVKNPVRIVAMAGTDRAGNPVEVVNRDATTPAKPDAAK